MSATKTDSANTDLTTADEQNLVTSANPASFDSEAMFIREVLRSFGISLETVMPASVVSYDAEKGLVKVRPLLKKIFQTTRGDRYQARDIIEMPVFRLQHGMFQVTAPLYPGDTGYMVAGHRDGSLALKENGSIAVEPASDGSPRTNNTGPQPPNTYLLHRYENGFFLPCRWGGVSISSEDAESLVISRLKTNETKAKAGVYEADGTEFKLTIAKDGTVKLLNGTGLVIASDEDKPSAIIDPTADLTTSDARFRVVQVPSSGVYTDSDGDIHIPTKKLRVLADESLDSGDDIVVPGGGEENKLEDVFISGSTSLKDGDGDEIQFSVTKTWVGKTLHFGLKLYVESNERVGYCNMISSDDNGFTDWTPDNEISRTPCGSSDG